MGTPLNTIPFKQVKKQYNDSNSIVCINLLTHQEECTVIDNYLSEQGLFNKGSMIEMRKIVDNKNGDRGRGDVLFILKDNTIVDPIKRMILRGLGIMWTSDFIDIYKRDYYG